MQVLAIVIATVAPKSSIINLNQMIKMDSGCERISYWNFYISHSQKTEWRCHILYIWFEGSSKFMRVSQLYHQPLMSEQKSLEARRRIQLLMQRWKISKAWRHRTLDDIETLLFGKSSYWQRLLCSQWIKVSEKLYCTLEKYTVRRLCNRKIHLHFKKRNSYFILRFHERHKQSSRKI